MSSLSKIFAVRSECLNWTIPTLETCRQRTEFYTYIIFTISWGNQFRYVAANMNKQDLSEFSHHISTSTCLLVLVFLKGLCPHTSSFNRFIFLFIQMILFMFRIHFFIPFRDILNQCAVIFWIFYSLFFIFYLIQLFLNS